MKATVASWAAPAVWPRKSWARHPRPTRQNRAGDKGRRACGFGATGPGHSTTHILREVEHSLRRLQTDYIDLYFLHWPDRVVPLETTLVAIDQCVRQGKVRTLARQTTPPGNFARCYGLRTATTGHA